MTAAQKSLLVWTTVGDQAQATKIAKELVEAQLAACVHILGQGLSFYRWEGEVHNEAEWTLLIKTRTALYPELEKSLQTLHPYDLPEILATEVVQGEPGYLRWLEESTKEPSTHQKE
ncbi:MAG: divalent-cation tolerance protein CutA [Magnetococcales bacterium]|nr:divalent-cation tolerance protein CutA [Magnetococcales bacterium]